MRDIKLGQLICKRVAQLLREHNLTIEQLAYQSGISKGGLSEIVREKKEPSNYTIFRICLALNIEMSQFYDFAELIEYSHKKA